MPSKEHRGGRLLRPSINRVKSSYERLRDEVGPIPQPSEEITDSSFVMACNEFPFERLQPALTKSCPDLNTARRYWPSAAFACSQYRFELSYRKANPDSERPGDLRKLVENIAQSAKSLQNELNSLQKHAYQLSNPTASMRQHHLAWINQTISQVIAGRISPDLDQSDEFIAKSYFARQDFVEKLILVEVAAKSALNRFDPKLLKKSRKLRVPALYNLTARASWVWKEMTGRSASVNKVHPTSSSTTSDDSPAFVEFVQGLAAAASSEKVTRKMVETAYDNFLSRQN